MSAIVIDLPATTFVTSSQPGNNFSIYPTVRVEKNPNIQTSIALLEIPLPSLPATTVKSALLQLAVVSKSGAASSPVTVNRLISPFNASTVTYHTIPSYAATKSQVNVSTADLYTTMQIDITDLVKSWLAGTFANYGIALTNSDSSTVVEFATNNIVYQPYFPQLIIQPMGMGSELPPAAQARSAGEIQPDIVPAGTALTIQPASANIDFSKSVGYQPVAESIRNGAPPYISFICFNRLGLTIKNLTNLLDSDEDFELNIIDCNSKDNSWDYIQSLTDRRIKSKIKFKKNYGPIYAVNFALSRRKPDQYFITMDSDTFIKTKNWIARFMEIFETFPEVGLLGLMRDNPYPRFLPPIIPRVSGSVSYLELKNANIETPMDFIPGQLQCLSPKLIHEIGYWSEENSFGDAEIAPRVVHYTNFKVGFATTIEIDMTQKITCHECLARDFCKLSRSVNDCFSFSQKYNRNESFVAKNTWKFKQTFQELKEGKRTAYCASIHDPESVKNHVYNAEWAYDNFNHYLVHSN